MSVGNAIPFVDLVAPHLQLEEQLIQAVRSVIRTGGFVGGPVLEQFEKNFARSCNVQHCIGVNSGTDALRFALMAAGVGKGDIVVTVPNTFVATLEAIVQAGAIPHFVDVDPQTYNMSAEALGRYLQSECDRSDDSGLPVHRESGKPVKAIMPVHLYGQMCDMDALTGLAERYGLMIFEDACQAHGSSYFSAKNDAWQRAGSIGIAGAFSFYPGKNLGACGEAGAVTTNDEALAQRVRMIRDHGQSKKYHHAVEGYNGRLDTMQAAILDVKLPHLPEWNQQRRSAAQRYGELLQEADGIVAPFEPDWSRGNYHLYVIRSRQRDEMQKYLSENNIGSGLHYPIPLHLQTAFAYLGYRQGDFPISEQIARECLSLPMFPQIRRDQQELVADAVLHFLKTRTVGVGA